MIRSIYPFRPSVQLLNTYLLATCLALAVAAQDRVDLNRHVKETDFYRFPYATPIQGGAPLPAIFKQAALFSLTSVPSRGNCAPMPSSAVPPVGVGSGTVPDLSTSGSQLGPLTPGGALRIQTSGVVVGTRGTVNFEPGTGIATFISDTGSEINIQQTIDSAVVQTRANLQSGQTLLCASASASGTSYTCSMSPILTAYTVGMIISWKPDQTAAGGATTLNVDELGAKSIKLGDGTNDPGESDIVKGRLYLLWFDGASFRKLF